MGPENESSDRLRVTFSAGSAASDLWAFGEDDLAEAALDLSDQQLLAAWRWAAMYYRPEYPLPVVGRRITLGHVVAFAAMTVLEGRVRTLARQRRRPDKTIPEHIRSAAAAHRPSLSEVHRLFGDHID
ncbi:MAG: hypothetical protein JJD93_19570 [Ilumatobacteraceae bacterium]|nr:hypothetical protein [Ilumatobacteraceae bacterium]